MEETKNKEKKVERKIVYKKPNLDKKEKFVPPLLDEGMYECEYLSTTEMQEDGMKWYEHKWRELTTNKWLTERSNTEFTPKSKLHIIFNALGFNLADGDPVDLTDLIGKRCNLVIKIAERTKKTGEKFQVNIISDHVRIKSSPVQSTLS